LTARALTQFINPNEWKLDLTDTNTKPVLNFILFIPSKNTSPLFIQTDNDTRSSTNAFVIPQWGGIVIYNPQNVTKKNVSLSEKDLLPIMQLFLGQLRELLGIPSTVSNIIPSTSHGIAQWEVDSLTRHILLYNINSSITTLNSLSKLVQNLTNMVILDNIASLCQTSLSSLKQADEFLGQRKYDEAFQASKQAIMAAEEAFFDPNMLSLLYFPDEHKLAIYALPFVPIFFQLASGIYAEYRSRRQIKKLKND